MPADDPRYLNTDQEPYPGFFEQRRVFREVMHRLGKDPEEIWSRKYLEFSCAPDLDYTPGKRETALLTMAHFMKVIKELRERYPDLLG